MGGPTDAPKNLSFILFNQRQNPISAWDTDLLLWQVFLSSSIRFQQTTNTVPSFPHLSSSLHRRCIPRTSIPLFASNPPFTACPSSTRRPYISPKPANSHFSLCHQFSSGQRNLRKRLKKHQLSSRSQINYRTLQTFKTTLPSLNLFFWFLSPAKKHFPATNLTKWGRKKSQICILHEISYNFHTILIFFHLNSFLIRRR